MKSREEIKNELTLIKEKFNMSGIALDILLEHSTDSIYLNQILNIQQLIESVFIRSTYLNSRLTHASSLMYSVPRGEYQRIRLDKVMILQNQTINKFDLIVNCGDFKLLADKSDVFMKGEEKSIDCIVCKDFAKETTLKPDTSGYLLYALESNISNDYELRIDNSIQLTTTDYYTYIENELIQGSNVLFDLTNTDYSAIFIKPINSWEVGKQTEKFNELSNITLKYLEYTEMINLQEDDKIKIKDSIQGFGYDNMEILGILDTEENYQGFTSRLEDKTIIFTNATNKFIAGSNMIRSVSDVSMLFMSKFNNILDMQKSKKLKNTYYYVTNNKYRLKKEDIDAYLEILRKSYFIDEISISNSSEKKLDNKVIYIEFYVNQLFDRMSFSETLNQFQFILGKTITVFEIMQKMSSITGIVRMNFGTPQMNERYLTEIELEENETINIQSIQYEIKIQNDIQLL